MHLSQTESNYQCLESRATFMKMLHDLFQDIWKHFEKMSCRDKVLDIFHDFCNICKKRLCQVVILKNVWVYHKNCF